MKKSTVKKIERVLGSMSLSKREMTRVPLSDLYVTKRGVFTNRAGKVLIVSRNPHAPKTRKIWSASHKRMQKVWDDLEEQRLGWKKSLAASIRAEQEKSLRRDLETQVYTDVCEKRRA